MLLPLWPLRFCSQLSSERVALHIHNTRKYYFYLPGFWPRSLTPKHAVQPLTLGGKATTNAGTFSNSLAKKRSVNGAHTAALLQLGKSTDPAVDVPVATWQPIGSYLAETWYTWLARQQNDLQ